MNSKPDAVLERLDKLIRLVSMMATKDMPQREQVTQLSKAGFQPKDIADLIGTTPHTVSVTLSELKKRARKQPRSGSERKSKTGA